MFLKIPAMEESKAASMVAHTDPLGIHRDPRFEVTWEPGDSENPRNWSVWYRSFIVASMSFSTTIVYVPQSNQMMWVGD